MSVNLHASCNLQLLKINRYPYFRTSHNEPSVVTRRSNYSEAFPRNGKLPSQFIRHYRISAGDHVSNVITSRKRLKQALPFQVQHCLDTKYSDTTGQYLLTVTSHICSGIGPQPHTLKGEHETTGKIGIQHSTLHNNQSSIFGLGLLLERY